MSGIRADGGLGGGGLRADVDAPWTGKWSTVVPRGSVTSALGVLEVIGGGRATNGAAPYVRAVVIGRQTL